LFQGSEIDEVADLRPGEQGAQFVGHDIFSRIDANARDEGLVGEHLGDAYAHEVDDHRVAAAAQEPATEVRRREDLLRNCPELPPLAEQEFPEWSPSSEVPGEVRPEARNLSRGGELPDVGVAGLAKDLPQEARSSGGEEVRRRALGSIVPLRRAPRSCLT